jgi:hypothetical protein
MHLEFLPLMIVPLLVWLAVWGYLWSLDTKVKKIEADLARLLEEKD